MGGRGAGSSGSGAGGIAVKGSLSLPGGDKIEYDGTLQYGKKDPALTGLGRKNIEDWEKKRVKNKVEYAFAVDGNGNPVGREIKGSKGSVRSPWSYHNQDNGAFTHIHPRESGMLGGTFSGADMVNFANGRSRTTRAAAKEGTYSISKNGNFDAGGFKSYVHQAQSDFSKNANKLVRDAGAGYRSGKESYSEYVAKANKAFNTALVQLHNDYLAGQRKYGYTYTLEQRS